MTSRTPAAAAAYSPLGDGNGTDKIDMDVCINVDVDMTEAGMSADIVSLLSHRRMVCWMVGSVDS